MDHIIGTSKLRIQELSERPGFSSPPSSFYLSSYSLSQLVLQHIMIKNGRLSPKWGWLSAWLTPPTWECFLLVFPESNSSLQVTAHLLGSKGQGTRSQGKTMAVGRTHRVKYALHKVPEPVGKEEGEVPPKGKEGQKPKTSATSILCRNHSKSKGQ